jgi:hypothetical protein
MAGRGNPLVNQKTLAELEAELEVTKAKIASTKANIQVEKAVVKSNQAAEERKLTGNRDADGNLMVERGDAGNFSGVDVESTGSGYFIDGVEIPIAEWDENQEFDAYGNAIPIMAEQVTTISEPKSMPVRERGNAMNLSGVEIEEKVEEVKPKLSDVTDAQPMNIPGIDLSKDDDVEEEIITDKQIARPEQEGRIADEPEKDTGGRRKATEIKNLRGEKAGWEMAEDSNFWSVNEKDPYWKTQEGYDEAVNLYGKKPSWLKEKDVATLVYNPSTGEYEEVEQEEFVDLSPPKKRISL